jgi:hypothetical protein
MDYNNIKQILEKYWEGETSLQEENLLHEYFNSDEVVEELKDIQPMFQYFRMEQTTRIENPNFDEQVLSQLDSTIVKPLRPMRSHRNRILKLVASVAAIFLIAFSGYFAFQQMNNEKEPIASETLQLEDLTEEERLAYEQTKAALAYLSGKMNKGTDIAASSLIKVHKATNKVFK